MQIRMATVDAIKTQTHCTAMYSWPLDAHRSWPIMNYPLSSEKETGGRAGATTVLKARCKLARLHSVHKMDRRDGSNFVEEESAGYVRGWAHDRTFEPGVTMGAGTPLGVGRVVSASSTPDLSTRGYK
jgi:hypothetical protein